VSAQKSILVVDDDVLILQLVRESLSVLLDCAVDTTTNPEYAFELILKRSYDLLIVDFFLPRIDGAMLYLLVSKLFAIQPPEGRTLPPLLLISGHAAEPRAQELLREPGVRGLIAKPFTIEMLIERVSEALRLG
jgi:CheY-like chemotaxis protein